VILPDVWIGGDFEVLKSGLVSGRLDGRQCRFFVGYSGWAPGQLATEFQTRSWLMAPGVADLVFHGEPDKLWLLAVRARAQVEPMFAHYPGNLRWN
jgi:putative transcriptional regulator